jgi:hypothetical protein
MEHNTTPNNPNTTGDHNPPEHTTYGSDHSRYDWNALYNTSHTGTGITGNYREAEADNGTNYDTCPQGTQLLDSRAAAALYIAAGELLGAIADTIPDIIYTRQPYRFVYFPSTVEQHLDSLDQIGAVAWLSRYMATIGDYATSLAHGVIPTPNCTADEAVIRQLDLLIRDDSDDERFVEEALGHLNGGDLVAAVERYREHILGDEDILMFYDGSEEGRDITTLLLEAINLPPADWFIPFGTGSTSAPIETSRAHTGITRYNDPALAQSVAEHVMDVLDVQTLYDIDPYSVGLIAQTPMFVFHHDVVRADAVIVAHLTTDPDTGHIISSLNGSIDLNGMPARLFPVHDRGTLNTFLRAQ